MLAETAAEIEEAFGWIGGGEAGEDGWEEGVLSSFELEEAGGGDAWVWVGMLRCFEDLDCGSLVVGCLRRWKAYDRFDVRVDFGGWDVAVFFEYFSRELDFGDDCETVVGHGRIIFDW